MKYAVFLCFLGAAMAASFTPYTPEAFYNRFNYSTFRPIADGFRAAALKSFFSKSPFEDIALLRSAAAVASAPEVATVTAAALYAAASEAEKFGVSRKDADIFRASSYNSLSSYYSPRSFDFALEAADRSGISSANLTAIRDFSSKYPVSNSKESTAALETAARYANGFAPETINKINAAASEAAAFGAALAKYFALRTATIESVARKESFEKVEAFKKAADYAMGDVIRTAFTPATALTRDYYFVYKVARGMALSYGLTDLVSYFDQIKGYGYSFYSSYDRSN